MATDLLDDRLGPLVVRAVTRDPDAWTLLFVRFTPLLMSVALLQRLSHADAQDAVQTTWMRALEHLDGLRDPQALPAWLVAICRRESLRLVRANARALPQDTTDLTGLIASAPDPAQDDVDHGVLRAELAEQVAAAVADLPQRQRVVVIELMHRGEDGYANASRRLGIPIGSLGPTRQRALTRLRRDPRLHPDWAPGASCRQHLHRAG